MMDLTPSILYIDENGTILEKARLLRILMDEPPSPTVYVKLLNMQNADGGFPSRPRPNSASAVDSTLTALWQLDELGMFADPPGRRALDFLVAMQQADGGWDENPNLPEHDLPPWIHYGEPGTRLYLSAYAAYWLGQASRGAQESPEKYQAALLQGCAFLAAWQGADTAAQPGAAVPPPASGQIPGYLHNNWLAASAFLLAGPAYAENAQRCLAYLEGLPPSAWEDSQIAWAVDCLDHAGLPARHPFIQASLAALRERRAPDGSWAAEEGPSFAAAATVGAIKVLTRLGGEA